MDRERVLACYAEYLEACNRHDVDGIVRRVAPVVRVNGTRRTRIEYGNDLSELFAAFPDYRWRLLRTVVDPPWLAVHLHDEGTRQGPFQETPGDGTRVQTDEFAIYRLSDAGLIAEVVVTADNARLMTLTPRC